MSLRATTIYCREDGAWKVIHRHGDGLMTVELDPGADADPGKLVLGGEGVKDVRAIAR
jgi:hypothetical protein